MSVDYAGKFDDLQFQFEDKINGYAERLADGKLTEAEWRRLMENTIRDSYARAWALGASVADGKRAILTEEERALVGREVSSELSYLRGFYTDLRTDLRSEDYIINRATQYANAIRGLYFQGMLGRTDDTLWEAWFIANEDDRSCDECMEAADNSPYLPSECPIPGSAVCEGFENCRCVVEFRPRTADATDRTLSGNEDLSLIARPHVHKRVHGGILIT